MIKIAVMGIACVVLCLMIKGMKSELTVILSLCTCILMFYFILGKLQGVIELFEEITGTIGLDRKYVLILLKMTGITFLSEFSSNLCKDAGYHAISGQIEMAGKITILSLSFPVFLSILETVGSMM